MNVYLWVNIIIKYFLIKNYLNKFKNKISSRININIMSQRSLHLLAI